MKKKLEIVPWPKTGLMGTYFKSLDLALKCVKRKGKKFVVIDLPEGYLVVALKSLDLK